MAGRGLHKWMTSELRLVQHRLADARWRSSVASCFNLIKEVVLQKETWDPENAVPTRPSKVTILNETGDYIKKLEEMISEELGLKAIYEECAPSGENETLAKVRADFLCLESSKFVQMQDVGPYVEQYLHILAKEELINHKSSLSKSLKSPEEEDAIGSTVVFNPHTGKSMWRVPNFKHKIRRKYRKTCRPTIVNLQKKTPEALRTPRCLNKKSSYPPIRSKNGKVSGCGRPGVKRRLLEEMEGIEDSSSEPVNTPEEMSSSQVTMEDVTEELDSVVPGDFTFPAFFSFTKILPAESQSVPYIECEVEVTTTEGAGKENLSSQLDPLVQCKARKRKSSQLVPDLDRLAYPQRPKKVLCEISTNSSQNDQCLPTLLFSGKRSESSAFQEYTALKNAMISPEKEPTFVKFGPVLGLSPCTSELLTQDDPLLISGSGQSRSPIELQVAVGYTEENESVVPVFHSPGNLWTSPSSSNVLSQEAFDSQFFGGFFFPSD